jgi:tetratricopeptide (TPR) repeat protein
MVARRVVHHEKKKGFNFEDFVVSYRPSWPERPFVMGKRKSVTLYMLALLLVLPVFEIAPAAQDYKDYYEQGEFALRVEKWDKAIDLLTKSIQDNPNFSMAYQNRAIAYSKKGDYQKSIQDLKKVVELNPKQADPWGVMGLVYEIMKDYPSAVHAYKEALSREKRPAFRKVIEKYLQDAEAKIKKK